MKAIKSYKLMYTGISKWKTWSFCNWTQFNTFAFLLHTCHIFKKPLVRKLCKIFTYFFNSLKINNNLFPKLLLFRILAPIPPLFFILHFRISCFFYLILIPLIYHQSLHPQWQCYLNIFQTKLMLTILGFPNLFDIIINLIIL